MVMPSGLWKHNSRSTWGAESCWVGNACSCRQATPRAHIAARHLICGPNHQAGLIPVAFALGEARRAGFVTAMRPGVRMEVHGLAGDPSHMTPLRARLPRLLNNPRFIHPPLEPGHGETEARVTNPQAKHEAKNAGKKCLENRVYARRFFITIGYSDASGQSEGRIRRRTRGSQSAHEPLPGDGIFECRIVRGMAGFVHPPGMLHPTHTSGARTGRAGESFRCPDEARGDSRWPSQSSATSRCSQRAPHEGMDPPIPSLHAYTPYSILS